MFLLIATVGTPAPDGALEALAAQPGCQRLRLAAATDTPGRYVLTAEFATAGDYRAALSPFDVRTRLVPWLSTAESGAGVFEVLAAADGTGTLNHHAPTVDLS